MPTKPNGKDWFGYSTHESYSVVPSERSNLIWHKWEKEDNWTIDILLSSDDVGYLNNIFRLVY